MTKSRVFWYFLQAGSIFLFAAAIGIGCAGAVNPAVSWVLFAGLLALHLAEIPVARRKLAGKNLSAARIAVKTTLFGFTWWLPVQSGVLDR
jgi:hypothetical protein